MKFHNLDQLNRSEEFVCYLSDVDDDDQWSSELPKFWSKIKPRKIIRIHSSSKAVYCKHGLGLQLS